MRESTRSLIAAATGLLVLGAVNATIYQRETHLATGRTVLLELAPVDPRSLMQGDYMALRFKAETDAFGRGQNREAGDGRIVAKLDAKSVASFVRLDAGAPLAEGEIVLRYRVRNGQVKFATSAFFFQEGQARRYQGARYGEFRVAPSGELLLTALRGKDLEPLY